MVANAIVVIIHLCGSSWKPDVWVGETPHKAIARHLRTSWADAPSDSFYQSMPLALDKKRVELAIPDTFSADLEDFKGLTRYLPVVSLSSGKSVFPDLGHGDGQKLPEMNCPRSLGSSDAQMKKADRLCGLYHHAYVLFPPDPPPSMAATVFEALLMGCVPVFLGKAPGGLDSPNALPINGVIRLADFNSIDELGAYLQAAVQGPNPKYFQYLEWKQLKPEPLEGFGSQLKEQRGNLICR